MRLSRSVLLSGIVGSILDCNDGGGLPSPPLHVKVCKVFIACDLVQDFDFWYDVKSL